MPNMQDSQMHAFNTAINPELMHMQGTHDRISFTGVTFRNFTLQSNINRLQMFCDNYLNFPDDPENSVNGHYFKAAAPCVTLSVINYGKMSTETENLGWIAQHEVLFSVPVEWYKVNENGQLIFHDWAYICPFIFVDNDQSLGVGREVYGWTKVRGWLQPSMNSWTSDPRKPRRVLSLGTELFPNLYSGDRLEARTVIEIVQDAPVNFFRSPFGNEDPYNPWWSASRNLRRSATAASSAMQAMTGLPLFGFDGARHSENGSLMLRKIMQNMLAGVPRLKPGVDSRDAARTRGSENSACPYMNNLTLKQFRDAQEPDLACYQALVNSRISIERLSDGGLLGSSNLMMGDPTGGYRIHVHEYAEQPIVEMLGLSVSETSRDECGAKVAVLSPTLPSWMSCDLRYDMGSTLSWRTKDSQWCQKPGDPISLRPDQKKNRFNTSLGAAIQPSVGPFHYPDTTMRVFPLISDKPQLGRFCDEFVGNLNDGESGAEAFQSLIEDFEKDMEAMKVDGWAYIDSSEAEKSDPEETVAVIARRRKKLDEDTGKLRDELVNGHSRLVEQSKEGKQSIPKEIGLNHFEPTGSNVYMVITNYGSDYGKMYSERNNLGRTATREVAFFMPVSWYSWDDSANCVRQRLVILTPYVFCDSMRHVLSESEVNGRPAIHSMIKSDDDWWLREWGPQAVRKICATVQTLLMPALNVGQPAEMRKIIEVIDGEPDRDLPTPLMNEVTKADAAASMAETKMLFDHLGKPNSFIDFLALKQYRATTDINCHCYQALVLVRKKVESIWHPRERIDGQVNVYIHSYPTMPIVKQLGIKVEHIDSRGDTVLQQINPINPASIRIALREEVGINLYSRLQNQSWVRATAEIDD